MSVCRRMLGCSSFLLPHCASRRGIDDLSHVPRVVPRRGRAERKVRDYGYFHNFYRREQRLPRLRNNMDRVPMPAFEIGDEWKPENALMGQNDYIDLLTDGKAHPAQLLYHVPRWLRGFPANKASELHKLIHYRNTYEQKLRRNMPKTWFELTKRISFLLQQLNYRRSDEIREERDVGLWKERPDYEFKRPAHEKFFKHYRDYYS